jgi:Zn-dependent protease
VDLFKNVDIVSIAFQFFVLLYSLTIHEASHAWMADRLGDYTARFLGRVTFNPIAHIDPIGTVLFPLLQYIYHFPLIGWAKPVPINSLHLRNPQKDQIFISLAGPVSNLLAGCAAFVLLIILKTSMAQPRDLNGIIDYMFNPKHYMSIPPQHSFLAPIIGILVFTLMTNIALAIFNLIPIPPLDGHWILYGLLPSNAAAALQSFGSYGFILLYALMFMGVFRFLFIPIYWMLDFLIRW